MSEKERALPKPPTTPFVRKKRFGEEEEKGPLMADKMAMAMAEGKLEEFLRKEMPEGEHARTLAMMMLGMAGMMPPEGLSSGRKKSEVSAEADLRREGPSSPAELPKPELPEDVLRAVRSGDVEGIKGLLERERDKRTPDAALLNTTEGEGIHDTEAQPAIEKDVIDRLIKIASDNDVTMDWVILRALKLYIREYRETGRL